MKFSALKLPLAALSLAAVFAACNSTGNDNRLLKKTYSGPLSALDSVPDATISRIQWRLIIDTLGQSDLKGTCIYTGYLGDTGHVGGQAPALDYLYTHSSMTGTKTAQEIRAEGIILSVDSASYADTLTHYRADFECET